VCVCECVANGLGVERDSEKVCAVCCIGVSVDTERECVCVCVANGLGVGTDSEKVCCVCVVCCVGVSVDLG